KVFEGKCRPGRIIGLHEKVKPIRPAAYRYVKKALLSFRAQDFYRLGPMYEIFRRPHLEVFDLPLLLRPPIPSEYVHPPVPDKRTPKTVTTLNNRNNLIFLDIADADFILLKHTA